MDERVLTSIRDAKGKFIEQPVLAMVEKTRPFELEYDASLYATGGVLW